MLATTRIETMIDNVANVKVVNKNLIVEGIDVAQIDIYSISGYLTAANVNSNTINLSNHKGIYIAIVTDKYGNNTTHKVAL